MSELPCLPDLPHDSSSRTEFLSSSCLVTAYPSVGGIVLGYFSAVELNHLHLSRFTPAKRSYSDLAEEDDLALRLLALGAHWWPSWNFYAHHQVAMSEKNIPYDFHFPPVIHVAYPSDGKGVWALEFCADSRPWSEGDPRKPYIATKPDAWNGRMRLVLTMDERCKVMQGFGAKFYENVQDCEDIPITLQDGVEKGRWYEELLKKMDDWRYVEKWLETGETNE